MSNTNGMPGEDALILSKNFTKKVAMGLTSVNVDNVNKTITFTLVADGSQHILQFDELTTTTTKEIVASITQGNIYPGKVYPIGTEYETILEDLVTQYLNPEVKLTIEPATTLYDIVNDTVDKITMYATVTKKTSDIAPTTVTTFVLPDTVVNQTNNSRITYQVKNGICCIAVQLALDAVSSAVTTWINVATGFPKPSFNISQTINSERNSSEVPMAMRMTAGGTLQMLFNGTTNTMDWWTTTFTYPVAK